MSRTSHKLKLARYKAHPFVYCVEVSDRVALIHVQGSGRHMLLLNGEEKVYLTIHWPSVKQKGAYVTFKYVTDYSELRNPDPEWHHVKLKIPRDPR